MIRHEIKDKFNYKGDPRQKKKDEIWLKNKKIGPFLGENACKNQG